MLDHCEQVHSIQICKRFTKLGESITLSGSTNENGTEDYEYRARRSSGSANSLTFTSPARKNQIQPAHPAHFITSNLKKVIKPTPQSQSPANRTIQLNQTQNTIELNNVNKKFKAKHEFIGHNPTIAALTAHATAALNPTGISIQKFASNLNNKFKNVKTTPLISNGRSTKPFISATTFNASQIQANQFNRIKLDEAKLMQLKTAQVSRQNKLNEENHDALNDEEDEINNNEDIQSGNEGDHQVAGDERNAESKANDSVNAHNLLISTKPNASKKNILLEF